jgi:hypothetical protein
MDFLDCNIPRCPLFIKRKLLEKRRLRRIWLRFRSPHIKRKLNKATRELKQLLSDNCNASFQHYIQNLSPAPSTDYFLWKVVKRMKHAPSLSPHFKQLKALGHGPTSPKLMSSPTIQHLFSSHTPPTYLMRRRNPSSVFRNPLTNSNPPLYRFKQSSTTFLPKLPVATTSSRVKILQELPPVGIKYITQLLNASLLLGYFPNQWKIAEIILLLKPGKPPHAQREKKAGGVVRDTTVLERGVIET